MLPQPAYRRTRLAGCGSRERCNDVTTCLRLPEGVHNWHIAVSYYFIVPEPGFWVDGFTNTPQDRKAWQVIPITERKKEKEYEWDWTNERMNIVNTRESNLHNSLYSYILSRENEGYNFNIISHNINIKIKWNISSYFHICYSVNPIQINQRLKYNSRRHISCHTWFLSVTCISTAFPNFFPISSFSHVNINLLLNRIISKFHKRSDSRWRCIEFANFVLLNYLPKSPCVWVSWHSFKLRRTNTFILSKFESGKNPNLQYPQN